MSADVEIDGVVFMSLFHRDGRFVRGGGLFAFSRRDPDGGRTIFHFELAENVGQAAGPGHHRWDYAIGRGMNEILVHLAGSQQRPGEVAVEVTCPPIRWSLHPDDIEVEGEVQTREFG